MNEKNEPKECQAFIISRHNLRSRGRKRMRKGYREDPKEYNPTILDDHCEELKAIKREKEQIENIFEIIGDIEQDENNNKER